MSSTAWQAAVRWQVEEGYIVESLNRSKQRFATPNPSFGGSVIGDQDEGRTTGLRDSGQQDNEDCGNCRLRIAKLKSS
jgi:hypothetical protein